MVLNVSNSTFFLRPYAMPAYSLVSDPAASIYYLIIVPIMIGLCFLAVLGNVYILACIRWIRKRTMTVNLILSLGLAGADAWAASLVILGLAMNCYLPIVHGVTFGRLSVCYFLGLELLRLAGMVTSNLHLLALALNHWFSIFNPLLYKKTVTVGWCRTVMITLWILPLLVLMLATVCIHGSKVFSCDIDFYFYFPFRLIIFLHFIIPLLTMLAIYGYILRRITLARSGKAGCDNSRRALVVARHRRPHSVAAAGEMTEMGDGRRQQCAAEMRVNSRSNVSQSKLRALMTTLLILGTFAVGWLPAVMQFTLVCIDCIVPYQPTRFSLFIVGVVVNSLIILKLTINPLIYAFRILEIRYALWHMHITRCGLRPVPEHVAMPDEFRNLDFRRSQLTSTLSAKSRRKEANHCNGRADKNGQREDNDNDNGGEMITCRKDCA